MAIFTLAAVACALLATPTALVSGSNLARDIGTFTAGLIVSGVLGKSIGLSAAALRYRSICRQLIERLQAL